MTPEEMLHDFAHKFEALCERFDAMEDALQYQTKLLETIVEAMPTGRPNVMKALAPLFESPIIKNNPMLADMVKNFTANMGGEQ